MEYNTRDEIRKKIQALELNLTPGSGKGGAEAVAKQPTKLPTNLFQLSTTVEPEDTPQAASPRPAARKAAPQMQLQRPGSPPAAAATPAAGTGTTTQAPANGQTLSVRDQNVFVDEVLSQINHDAPQAAQPAENQQAVFAQQAAPSAQAPAGRQVQAPVAQAGEPISTVNAPTPLVPPPAVAAPVQRETPGAAAGAKSVIPPNLRTRPLEMNKPRGNRPVVMPTSRVYEPPRRTPPAPPRAATPVTTRPGEAPTAQRMMQAGSVDAFNQDYEALWQPMVNKYKTVVNGINSVANELNELKNMMHLMMRDMVEASVRPASVPQGTPTPAPRQNAGETRAPAATAAAPRPAQAMQGTVGGAGTGATNPLPPSPPMGAPLQRPQSPAARRAGANPAAPVSQPAAETATQAATAAAQQPVPAATAASPQGGVEAAYQPLPRVHDMKNMMRQPKPVPTNTRTAMQTAAERLPKPSPAASVVPEIPPRTPAPGMRRSNLIDLRPVSGTAVDETVNVSDYTDGTAAMEPQDAYEVAPPQGKAGRAPSANQLNGRVAPPQPEAEAQPQPGLRRSITLDLTPPPRHGQAGYDGLRPLSSK